MLYSQITLLAVISTAACLPQSLDAGFTHDSYRRDELADLYPRYDSEALEVLADRSLWSSLEERGFEDEELLFERSDDDLFDLYARVAVKAPKPPVPPKPDHLKASKTNPSQTTSKSDGSSSGTDWTKKVQDDAKKENKSHWYNKLGVGNKDKGKKNPDNPVPNLEKIAGDQAHKITGYNRKESDATDKKNNKARIKNQKEEEINKLNANKLANHNSKLRWFNTGKDAVMAGTGLTTAVHTLGLLRRELELKDLELRDPYALWDLDLELDEVY